MMRISYKGFVLQVSTLLLLLSGCTPAVPHPAQASAMPNAYNYPINNPYAATIIGVPPALMTDYSALPKPQEEVIHLFHRTIPEGFWYQDGLRYSHLLQPNPAPLAYVVAGTGADVGSQTMLTLADQLYAHGFSVVLLPSPTHPNFIINASTNFTPGRPLQDAADLYRVITQVDIRVARKAKITRRVLVGYSLGAIDALYAEQLDEREKTVGFARVLLINPPLNLYRSMQKIDHMLYRALPDGIDDADSFVKNAVSRLSGLSQSGDALDFANERLLVKAYNTYKPDDASLATLIGLSFRLAAVNMIFTADVMGHDNYIFPKNRPFTTSTPLNNYMSVALRTSFTNYLDDIYTEKFQATDPGLTKQDLLAEGDLELQASYLHAHPNIGMITNRDDIILAKGDADRLVGLFGANATVFPNGGHLGNLGTPAVTDRIVRFLKE